MRYVKIKVKTCLIPVFSLLWLKNLKMLEKMSQLPIVSQNIFFPKRTNTYSLQKKTFINLVVALMLLLCWVFIAFCDNSNCIILWAELRFTSVFSCLSEPDKLVEYKEPWHLYIALLLVPTIVLLVLLTAMLICRDWVGSHLAQTNRLDSDDPGCQRRKSVSSSRPKSFMTRDFSFSRLKLKEQHALNEMSSERCCVIIQGRDLDVVHLNGLKRLTFKSGCLSSPHILGNPISPQNPKSQSAPVTCFMLLISQTSIKVPRSSPANTAYIHLFSFNTSWGNANHSMLSFYQHNEEMYLVGCENTDSSKTFADNVCHLFSGKIGNPNTISS